MKKNAPFIMLLLVVIMSACLDPRDIKEAIFPTKIIPEQLILADTTKDYIFRLALAGTKIAYDKVQCDKYMSSHISENEIKIEGASLLRLVKNLSDIEHLIGPKTKGVYYNLSVYSIGGAAINKSAIIDKVLKETGHKLLSHKVEKKVQGLRSKKIQPMQEEEPTLNISGNQFTCKNQTLKYIAYALNDYFSETIMCEDSTNSYYYLEIDCTSWEKAKRDFQDNNILVVEKMKIIDEFSIIPFE